MSKLKFAIIGCGRISVKHIEALIANRETSQLVALADRVKEKAMARKKQYQAVIKDEDVKIYTDYREMLKKEEIGAVVVATESGLHAQQTIDCLKADKNVLVEKPMALSLSDSAQMIELAREKGLKLGVCYQNRFNPPIRKLRRAVEEGRFGKIISGSVSVLWSRDDDYYKQAAWRGTKKLDGGVLMNQAIHSIDLLQWMINSEVERVHSERDTFLREIEMEDFGALLIRFKNRAIGIVEGSACVYPKNLEKRLSIFGEKGTVIIGGLAVNEIKVWQFADQRDYDQEESHLVIDDIYGDGHIALYKDFREAIIKGREPLINGEEGQKSLQIVLKAYEN